MAQRNLAKLSDDEVFADWQRWAERMYDETVGLGWNRRMFRMMREVAERNELLQETGGHLLDWMFENYVVAAAMTFRRELDLQSGTENLRHLLEEIQQRPQVLNRTRHLDQWDPKNDAERYMANYIFDKQPRIRIEGHPEQDYLDPESVAADREHLKRETELVREYVERTYAHRVPKSNLQLTFDEFHAAVDAIVPVFQKYYALLTLKSVPMVEPTPQFDTHECLTFPWWIEETNAIVE